MNNPTSTGTVTLLVGDPVDDPGEHRFLRRLVEDLEAAGVEAVVYANFITPGRNQRQVDVLIWTPHGVFQIEVKVLDQSLPVLGGVNGEWVQLLPDGATLSLGKNCFRQALQATFAVSDRLVRLVGSHAHKPAKDIDTIVCIYRNIPAGSTFERFDYVTVIGYPDLLTRLTAPGRSQPWSREVWERLARDLNVYDPREDSAGRAALDQVIAYRQRAAASWSAQLAPRVETGLVLGSEHVAAEAVDQQLRSGESVLLAAPSGYGKTFLARHLALRRNTGGDLVLWLRADEYERGQLHRLLAKAAAPFSSAPVMDLVRTAAAAGLGVVVVIDGLNECPPGDQCELLEQLAALRLRYRSGVLVTSTGEHALPEGLAAVRATLLAPDEEQRIAVLDAHGAGATSRVSAAFTTPHDLALAARCSATLQPDARVTDLHDTYIRTLSPTEAVRAGLRDVAALLHRHHRSSAPVLDVTAHLAAQGGAGLPAALVDDVMANDLLDRAAGRVRFRHDLLRDFLVAEHLVLQAPTPGDLAERLREPTNRSLVRNALQLERDAERAVEVLDRLADRDLYVAGLLGELGVAVQERLRHATKVLLEEAAGATAPGCAVFEPEEGILGRWVMARSWEPSTARLLEAAGLVLDPEHLHLVAWLLDRTDDFLRAALDAPVGTRVPTVSHAVAAAYALQQNFRPDSLPASFLVASCERHGPLGPRRWSAGVRQYLLKAPKPGWGRCWVAAQAIDDTDGDVLADLVRHALRLGGYHLVLHTLWAVGQTARSLSPAQRDAVLAALDGYDPQNWGLSSTLVEALAALGAIEPLRSLGDIRAEIGVVLGMPNDPDAPALAAGIISSQFEEEDIVGPYCEAVEGLDRLDRLRLILLAARHPGPSLTAGWRARELAHGAPTGDMALDAQLLELFGELARLPAAGGFAPQEDVEVFLYAVEGVARLGGSVPPPEEELSDEQTAWRLIAQVLVNLHRGERTDGDTWARLREAVPAAVPDVLSRMRSSQMSAQFAGERRAYDLLVGAYPAEVRRALHWALEHLGALTSLWPSRATDGLAMFVADALGTVGDQSTVARLEPFAVDDRLGDAAVRALHAINERLVTGAEPAG